MNQVGVEMPNVLFKTQFKNQRNSASIDCPAQNFLEHNSSILDLLCPHFLQAYQNSCLLTQILHLLAQLIDAAEWSNTIILSVEGKVSLMTQRAWTLLKEYFQSSSLQRTCLPECLQQWVMHQISLTQNVELRSLTPLQIEWKGGHLIIRFISDCSTERYLLLLEERLPCRFSPEFIEFLGLTKREAEVLFWIAQGKANAEVATMLHISDRTVKKHLKHIYEKLGVYSRAAAIAYTIENLGMLTLN